MSNAEQSVARSFPRERLDDDALAVVRTLQQRGYIAYFVGGCVRDLLLGRTPKDFDIATEATPEELREVFGRRCRIIGRRFQLAHVRSGSSILEVATFRGTPEDQETAGDESGFVVRANTFGTPREDAQSRDFTMNGLFYDPVNRKIIDHIGGLADIERRKIVSIGDADQRFREDPVRLLRAVRFAAKLGLDMDDDVVAASAETAPLILNCPIARVSEELLRIFESGYARPAMEVMTDLGIMEPLIPELGPVIDTPEHLGSFLDWLGEIDRLVASHGGVPRDSLFSLIAWPAVERCLDEDPPERSDWGRQLADRIHETGARLSIPQKYRHRLKGALNIMGRVMAPARRKRSASNILRSPSLPLALTLLRMRFVLGIGAPHERDEYERWAELAEERGIWAAPHEPRVEEDDDGGGRSRKKRRRRRRGGRKRKSND